MNTNIKSVSQEVFAKHNVSAAWLLVDQHSSPHSEANPIVILVDLADKVNADTLHAIEQTLHEKLDRAVVVSQMLSQEEIDAVGYNPCTDASLIYTRIY